MFFLLTRSFDDFISMKFLIAVFLPASPFISFGDFYQSPGLLQPLLLFETREYIFSYLQK